MTVLTRSSLRRNQLQGTVFPGITQLTPPGVGISAKLRGGMGFGLGGHFVNRGMHRALAGLGALGDYATDANGNVIYDANGNPVQSTDYASIAGAVQAGLAVLNSQQVFQLNLQRAQQGLQPISVPSPTVGLNIAGINSSTLLLIGGGLVLLMLAKR